MADSSMKWFAFSTAAWLAGVGTALGLVLATSTAWAAELVAVRVDDGVGATRLVFELDGPASYRLARTQNGRGSGDLFVALDATARSRNLPRATGLVDSVRVFEGGSDPALIHVRLREPGLEVIDNVLINPQRLVVDVTRPDYRAEVAWEQTKRKAAHATDPFATPASPARSVAPTKTRGTPARVKKLARTELREVRIGSHPAFSRVVFELDSPTSYQIETPNGDGSREFVVTLSASAEPSRLASKSEFIEGVSIETHRGKSVARVRLRSSNVELRELTLANPDRIVIDVQGI